MNRIEFYESNLPEGIYSVQIISTEQTITKKILKIK
ncbi:MAG: T9SS type A sorting domain-containing protein [Bacteroidota bacterium]